MTSSNSHNYLQRTECPCCGSSVERARLVCSSVPPAEQLPVGRHSSFASGYKSERVFFSYFSCDDCHARYCKHFYANEQLQTFYREQSENMEQVPLLARQRAQEEYAKLLLSHVRGTGSLLEIGPDIGLFAGYCARQGCFDHFWMLEPNLVVHDDLRARLQGYPATITDDMWPTADIPSGSVSAAAMVHVLDHLLDPRVFLSTLREKLTPEGVVITVAHNSASTLARLLGKRWPPHALQHPQLYSPRSISRLYERAGFKIEQIAPARNYFPVMHLAKAGLAVVGIKDVLPDASGPTVPIKLGNIAVIARKV